MEKLFLNKFEYLLRKLAMILAGVGAITLLLFLILVCANIILRPFGHGIRGTVEMSGFLCAIAVGLFLPAAQFAGTHISAGFWADRQPRSLRRAQDLAINLFCAFLLTLAGKELLLAADYSYYMGEYVVGFKLPIWAIILGLALGVLTHALCFIHIFLRCIADIRETPKRCQADKQQTNEAKPGLITGRGQ